jgi:23S rRNA (pseudouridine1915-N3)-methyltransferase
MIRIVVVGKRHESWVAEGIERFSERLRAAWNIEWVFIPHSAHDGRTARLKESQHILSRCNPNEYIVLLDERGTLYDSPTLARLLDQSLLRLSRLTIIIGGAHGVDETVRSRADVVWSLSPAVFPHQLVRLILVEQLYRSQEIVAGRPYHHQ